MGNRGTADLWRRPLKRRRRLRCGSIVGFRGDVSSWALAEANPDAGGRWGGRTPDDAAERRT